MNRVDAIIREYFGSRGGGLTMGGLLVKELAGLFGTPLFIYDRQTADRKLDLLRETLPARFAISYSVKANPNPAVVRHFVSRGCGLEIASTGEFDVAVAAGCETSKILFAGPGKTRAELELVLAKGIGEIHVESMREVECISQVGKRLGVRARVAVRVNASEEVQGGAMRMGGKSSPFGIDEEQVDGVVDRIVSDSYLQFWGVHLFTGTQILDDAILASQYRRGLDIAKRIAERTGQLVRTVDFGGGLGVPYFEHEQPLNMNRLREELRELACDIEGDSVFHDTLMMVEPGRFLVAESGVYLAKVLDIKVSRGKKYLILDGGMNHHLAASGNLGQTIKRNYPMTIVNRLDEAEREEVEVVGPLCTPLDTLGRSVKLPPARIGDLLGIFQSGAYGRSASPLGFLSHPTPPEVWIDQHQAHVVRPRGN